MAIPIITDWKEFFNNENEGLGSSYERVIINNLLDSICQKYHIQRVLEAPLFGFTGISGINSMNLVRNGLEVSIVDNNSERLVMIETKWQECKLPVDIKYSQYFLTLPFSDKEFDMSWNFSALWFTKDLDKFLSELDRVTKKTILLIVPNRTGLGYFFQSLTGTKGYKELINIDYIKHKKFSKILSNLGWQEIEDGLIDCPPWPDIGMKKELLAKKLMLSFLLDKHQEQRNHNSIMEYYRGEYDQFPQQMTKYNIFERLLPRFLKQFWAHHHYYVYVKTGS